jgi:hypothetical protein
VQPFLPTPVDCGIPAIDPATGQTQYIPILAVGNDDLKLEETEAWELGYSGVLASKVFLTVDYYRAKNNDFITDLVPQVGTILGDLEGCSPEPNLPSNTPEEDLRKRCRSTATTFPGSAPRGGNDARGSRLTAARHRNSVQQSAARTPSPTGRAPSPAWIPA